MISPREALERLREGNRRFVSDVRSGNTITGQTRRNELAAGQEPFAIILGCSDSRVPAEIVFDQGLVHRSINTFTDHVAKRSNFFQRCTTGAALISAIPSKILRFSSALDWTRICLRKVCAIFPNRVSTKLSHEPCLGVWT